MNKSVHIQILHFEQILDKQTNKYVQNKFLTNKQTNTYRVLISSFNYVLSPTQVRCGMASEDLCE
jgi:hypothetical protein